MCIWPSLSFTTLLNFFFWSFFLFSLGLGFPFPCLLIGCCYVFRSEMSMTQLWVISQFFSGWLRTLVLRILSMHGDSTEIVLVNVCHWSPPLLELMKSVECFSCYMLLLKVVAVVQTNLFFLSFSVSSFSLSMGSKVFIIWVSSHLWVLFKLN
jgi:hypothetical protein